MRPICPNFCSSSLFFLTQTEPVMDHVPSSFLSVTLRYWKNIRCRKRFSLAFAGTGLKSSNHIYVQQLNTNMRRNIEIFISGRASSTRPGTEGSVSVSQKRTTSTYEEKESKTHPEESHHNSHVSSEKDSSASAKPLDTFACVQQSAKVSGDFQARTLQSDNIKPLPFDEVDNKPQSITEKPSKPSLLGNLYCQS